ncbi:hypothetical protein ABE504_03165 [Paenibacillus oryzisoli]|uniref:hypothetical protein n=1 Tax=Paenibacillus oryzisoli TaxID=1850517 RepID=UPI003D2B02D8
MPAQTTDQFSAFASLHRYFTLIETEKPTLAQAEKAAEQLYRIFGADSEEDLLRRGNEEIIQTYNEIKQKIIAAAI